MSAKVSEMQIEQEIDNTVGKSNKKISDFIFVSGAIDFCFNCWILMNHKLNYRANNFCFTFAQFIVSPIP